MKTKIAPRPLTYRETLLATNGPGKRPCLDGACNWLGCTHCQMTCILEPRHSFYARYTPPTTKSAPDLRHYKAG